MSRPVTLFTGQWADLPLIDVCRKAKEFGYDGLELCCWGDHFEVDKADQNYCNAKVALLESFGLKLVALSTHLVGQAVSDKIDERHKQIVPDYVWGNGEPEEVNKRAADEVIATAEAAKRCGLDTVVGFTGSPIWHLLYAFPPLLPNQIENGYKQFASQWKPILDRFQELGVRFALEVHPTEIAFDIVSAEQTLNALNNHAAFGFNFDPSHLGYQGVDYVGFINRFADRIFHVHIKDAGWSSVPKECGVFGGHLNFGDHRRYWDFMSPGRGNVNFEPIVRALNRIGYNGPLSVEWEDCGMDREMGAREACQMVRKLDFKPSMMQFDDSFS